jgi:hypothetical protein
MVGTRSGLDAKNLSCNHWRKPKEHVCFHRNICPNQYLLLSVGALLYIYAEKNGIEVPDLVTGNQEPIYFFLKSPFIT